MMCRADAADSIDETCARAGTRTWRLGVRLLTGPVGAASILFFRAPRAGQALAVSRQTVKQVAGVNSPYRKVTADPIVYTCLLS